MESASPSKENILKKIKKALATPVPLPFDKQVAEQNFFVRDTADLEIQFAENFTALQGRFSFCANESELVEQLETLFKTRQWDKIFLTEPALKEILSKNGLQLQGETNSGECDAAVTSCEFLVVRTGSIVLSSVQNSRTVSVYAPVHICIAYTSQLVFDINDSLELLKKKYILSFPSLISFASGPSRTADIEKTLVTGVHGPKEVFCFLIQSP